MKIRKLHIDKYKVFQNFDITFTNNDGKSQNLVVIAGINGSGKTTLFEDFIYPTFHNKIILKNSFIEIEDREKDDNKIVTLDTEFLQGDILNRNYRDNILFPKFKNIIFYEAGIANKKSAKNTIVQFIDKLIYEYDKKSSEAYLATQEILQSIFQDFEMQIEFNGLDKKREVLFKNERTGKMTIDDLSSGEQELITKAFSLYLDDIKDHIILIDEPESSLHPSWQSRIASIYEKFADKNNNQIILATHSPHIVASVHKEQIRVLVKEDHAIRAIDSFIGSYGWRVDRVLLEIFRLKGLRTPAIESKLEDLRKMVFANQYATEGFKELENELIASIGYDDMDLALIRMEVAKRKVTDEANR